METHVRSGKPLRDGSSIRSEARGIIKVMDGRLTGGGVFFVMHSLQLTPVGLRGRGVPRRVRVHHRPPHRNPPTGQGILTELLRDGARRMLAPDIEVEVASSKDRAVLPTFYDFPVERCAAPARSRQRHCLLGRYEETARRLRLSRQRQLTIAPIWPRPTSSGHWW
jgi:hypothetical protein